jgi:ABC-type multidrug transport system permease subunit
MVRTAKSIFKAILTMLFIVVSAAVLAGIGFIILVIALYYTWMLFLNYGLLAGGLAVAALAAILFIATRLLIKQIRKDETNGGNN